MDKLYIQTFWKRSWTWGLVCEWKGVEKARAREPESGIDVEKMESFNRSQESKSNTKA